MFYDVTSGQTGRFADATATTFNGTDSQLQLPSRFGPDSNAASVSMWFKTSSTSGGILYQNQLSPIGMPNSAAIQTAVYVGTDGKLYGGYYNGGNPLLVSPGAVNDGKWHYMVLSGAGVWQVLYLDGAQVATSAGSRPLFPQTQQYLYVGAGTTGPSGWTALPASRDVHFNGSISDVAVYGTGLSGPQVAEQWSAAQNSSGITPALITKVIDPSTAATRLNFDNTTYSAASPVSWDLAGARLAFQSDGDLAVYSNYQTAQNTGTRIWDSGTTGSRSAVLVLQADGNMVIYSDSSKTTALWATGTNVGAGNYATFAPDGDFSVYRADGALLYFKGSPVSNAAGVVSSVLDPNAGGRPLIVTDATGVATSYGYDTGGFVNTVTDGMGNVVTTGHDIRGNEVSRTTCQVQSENICSTAYYTYWPDDVTAQPAPDPRNDMVTSYRDPRSSSASDSTYLTAYTYDASGNQTSVTTPPVPGYPNGRTSATTYTTSATAALPANTGTAPPGLIAKRSTPGSVSTFTNFYANGDVYSTTDAAGLVTSYTYDNLGRMKSKTVSGPNLPSAETDYTVDGLGRITGETDPEFQDMVSGAMHKTFTQTTYDADGNVQETDIADADGNDRTRTTKSHYNGDDQQDSATDADGNVTQYFYDAHGDRNKVIDAAGTTTVTAYDADGRALQTTLLNYTGNPADPSAAAPLIESVSQYDSAGRLWWVKDAQNNESVYSYTDNGLVAGITRLDGDSSHNDPTTHLPRGFQLQTNVYDAAGNLLSRTTNNGATKTAYQVDAASRVVSSTLDPGGVNRTTTYSFTIDDAVAAQTLTDGTTSRTTTYGFDTAGRATSQVVHEGLSTPSPASAAGLTGSWPLGDGQSATALDSSGGGDNGSLSTYGATWSADHGGSLALDGASGAATMAHPAVDTTQSFTVSTWAKANANGSLGAIVAQNGTNQGTMTLYADAGSTHNWNFAMASADTGWAFDVAMSGVAVVPGQWVYLTGVYDSKGQTIAIYVNGQLKGSASHKTQVPSSSLEIGRMKGNGAEGSYFNGSVAGTRVYSRALSGSEVANLYGGVPGNAPQNGLVGQWNMMDGNVVAAADSSGANHPLTLSGNGSWSTDQAGSVSLSSAALPWGGALTFPGTAANAGVGTGGCLDSYLGSQAQGTVVEVWSCNGGSAQQWSLNTNGTVTFGTACLDIANAGTTNGALVRLWTCNSTPAQQWQMVKNIDGTSRLVNPTSGRCLYDPGLSVGNAAAQLQIYDCGGANAANENLSGFTGPASLASSGPVITDTTQSFSVAARVDLTSSTTSATAVGQDGNTNSAFQLQYDAPDNKWNFARAQTDATNTPGTYRAMSTAAPALNTWTQLVGTYDATSKTMTLYVNGAAQGTAVDTTAFPAHGAFTVGRALRNGAPSDFFPGEINNVQTYNRALTATEVSNLYGGHSILPSDTTYTTQWSLDARGLKASSTDALGNETDYSYDAEGRLTTTLAPSVTVEPGDGTTTVARPTTTVGYDSFGEPVETKDPNGHITVTNYYPDSRVHTVTKPGYTPPGSTSAITATTTETYDTLGNPKTLTDPLGNVTTFQYDQRSQQAQVANPDGSWTRTYYDSDGEPTEVIDADGATTTANWDFMGRKVSSYGYEQSTNSQYHTQYIYGTDGGNGVDGALTQVIDPSNVSTTYGYDRAGQMLWSQDGAGNTTSFTYDFMGDKSVTRPARRIQDPDRLQCAAGALPADDLRREQRGGGQDVHRVQPDRDRVEVHRRPRQRHLLRLRRDRCGTHRGPAGGPHSHDQHLVRVRRRREPDPVHRRQRRQLDHEVQQLEPGRVQHRAGHQRLHRGRGPYLHHGLRRRRPAGLRIRARRGRPGLPVRLHGQRPDRNRAAAPRRPPPPATSPTTTAAGRATAATDAAGPQAATSEAFTYNGRGELLTASGTAGSSTFTYALNGSMASRSDGSGTTAYQLRQRRAAPNRQRRRIRQHAHLLLQHPRTRSRRSPTAPARMCARSPTTTLHLLHSDTLATSGGATVASIGYTYDADGNLLTKTTTGSRSAASNTYTYDEANRLSSWKNGTTTLQLRLRQQRQPHPGRLRVFAYDARDELTTDGNATYGYSARGTQILGTTTGGETTAAFDAFGQTVSQRSTSYTYDAPARDDLRHHQRRRNQDL